MARPYLPYLLAALLGGDAVLKSREINEGHELTGEQEYKLEMLDELNDETQALAAEFRRRLEVVEGLLMHGPRPEGEGP